MSAAVHRVEHTVRFHECDPAGIVFYPNYFLTLNGLVEDWFVRGLDVDYHELYRSRQLALPTVHIECDFKRPSHMGESLVWALELQRMGKTSLDMAVLCAGALERDVRMSAQVRLVFVSRQTAGAVPIPADIRSAMERWLAAERATGVADGGASA